MIWSRLFGRPAAVKFVEPEAGAEIVILAQGEALVTPPPITCAEAGRGGYIVRHDRERAKIRETTIALAEKIGRPELADPLR